MPGKKSHFSPQIQLQNDNETEWGREKNRRDEFKWTR